MKKFLVPKLKALCLIIVFIFLLYPTLSQAQVYELQNCDDDTSTIVLKMANDIFGKSIEERITKKMRPEKANYVRLEYELRKLQCKNYRLYKMLPIDEIDVDAFLKFDAERDTRISDVMIKCKELNEQKKSNQGNVNLIDAKLSELDAYMIRIAQDCEDKKALYYKSRHTKKEYSDSERSIEDIQRKIKQAIDREMRRVNYRHY